MSSVSSINSLISSSSTASSSASSVDLSSLLAAATGATSPGIDVTSAVDAAIYAAQAPERQWQAQQTTVQSQITALTSIQTATNALSSDLDALNDPIGALAARTVTSTNPSIVTATATTGATVGSHLVTVDALATSASWYSPSLSGANATLGSSTLTITKNDGTQTAFNLGSTGSLSALATAINGASLGVTASVVNDANGSRLALVGQTTGSESNFTVGIGSTTVPTWSSASLPTASSTLAASTFQVGDGTSSAMIAVAAGSSLAQVANQINSQGLQLTASVVSDASGSHLSVVANSGGEVTMSSDPTLGFTQANQGSNASLTIDGVPVSSSTNTVTGAILGLSLNLQGADKGTTITLGVTADTSTISSAVSQFVTDYNSAVSLVNAQFTYSTANGTQGVLGSDVTVRSLQSTLLGLSGYNSQSGSASGVSTLGNLGITMNDDGTLSLDTEQLNQTLATNPSGAQNFFQGTALNGFAQAAQKQLEIFSSPANGTIAADLKTFTQQYKDLQTDVDNYESGYIASQRTVLTTMYSNAEIALQQLPTTLKQLQAQLGNNSGN